MCQFASVVRGAVVGKDCVIGPCALVDASRLGDGCRIGHGASINPGMWLGDDVFVGPGAVFCNDVWPEVDKAGFDFDAILSGALSAVIVENGASIGAGAIILPGVRIGSGALVAAGAVVSRDVPRGQVWTRSGETIDIPPNRRERRMRGAC